MVSINRLRERRSDFRVQEWMLDSSAFTEVAKHGGFMTSVTEYADLIQRWARCGRLVAAVGQDYMCEPFALAATGLTIPDHQRLTIERYDALRELVDGVYVMPVLQGYRPAEYSQHVRDYGERLAHGAWVGVGSVCKRNGTPSAIVAVLAAIRAARPDLRLHGFGVKYTALNDATVRGQFASADSMAWSFAARREGRDANDWREAVAFANRVETAAASVRQLGLDIVA
jgi:hypothetical protein